jgi:DNA-binding MarR family transcriptional regulator
MVPTFTPQQPPTPGRATEQDQDHTDVRNESIWRLLDNTRFAVSRLREIELNPFGLTIEQSSILKILMSLGGSSNLGELEYVTLRQSHTLSTLISRMNRSGLIGKKRSQSEKRYTVYVTPKGQDLLDGVTANSIIDVFSCLSPKQLQDFVRLFAILRNRALGLLRVPFLEYMVRASSAVPPGQNEPWRTVSPESAWTLFDGTRFVIARLREMEIGRFGLTMEQAVVLQTISFNGGMMTTRSLEEAMLRQHHTISVIVNRMIKVGLLTKTRRTGENRDTILISRKGRVSLQSLSQLSIEMTFSALKNHEKERLTFYLRLLHDKSRALLGKPIEPVLPE